MQIVQISPSRRSNQVWLKFDDQSLLPYKIDDVVIQKLKKFTDISGDLYQCILETSAKHLLSEAALRHLAISPKTEKVLSQKLQQYSSRIIVKYNYPSSLLNSLIGPIIDNLKSSGLLDEQQYIDYLVRKYPKKSISELNYILKSLGINRSLTVPPEQELVKILNLIQKKYSNVDYSDYKSKNQVVAKLYRKGFALELIKTAIDEYLKIR